MVVAYTLISVLIVSLISFVGVFTLTLKQKRLSKILLFLISFSAGALLGDSFIHLLPEMIEEGFTLLHSIMLLAGILGFFVMEKIVCWRHCHLPTTEHHPHPLATMNLVGDSLHNFIDGMIIAGSYFVSVPAGIATTIAVVLHEIPQEIGDIGVLLHAGLARSRVLLYNFLSALVAFLGAFIVLFLGSSTDIIHIITPITIGGFVYIAGSDLIPELHKETAPKKTLVQLIGLFMGVGVMLLLLLLE